MEIEPIAHIEAGDDGALVVFEPAYRDPNALRGIEGFGRLWLIWGTSERPAAGGAAGLGGTPGCPDSVGNGLALTAVALEGVEPVRGRGTVLHVGGAALPDGAPVFDVKPYVPYTDAVGGEGDGGEEAEGNGAGGR